MTDYNKLFANLEQASNSRKQQNVMAFIAGLESRLISDLDKAFSDGDPDKYNKLVSNIKNQGIKVFRNNDGKHKLDMTNFDFSLIGSMLNRI